MDQNLLNAYNIRDYYDSEGQILNVGRVFSGGDVLYVKEGSTITRYTKKENVVGSLIDHWIVDQLQEGVGDITTEITGVSKQFQVQNQRNQNFSRTLTTSNVFYRIGANSLPDRDTHPLFNTWTGKSAAFWIYNKRTDQNVNFTNNIANTFSYDRVVNYQETGVSNGNIFLDTVFYDASSAIFDDSNIVADGSIYKICILTPEIFTSFDTSFLNPATGPEALVTNANWFVTNAGTSYTFTIGTQNVVVRGGYFVGGGGGGGSGNGTPGGGGGGGGAVKIESMVLFAGRTYRITVGTGGSANNSGFDTTFTDLTNNETIIRAYGGGRGFAGASSLDTGLGGTGGGSTYVPRQGLYITQYTGANGGNGNAAPNNGSNGGGGHSFSMNFYSDASSYQTLTQNFCAGGGGGATPTPSYPNLNGGSGGGASASGGAGANRSSIPTAAANRGGGGGGGGLDASRQQVGGGVGGSGYAYLYF